MKRSRTGYEAEQDEPLVGLLKLDAVEEVWDDSWISIKELGEELIELSPMLVQAHNNLRNSTTIEGSIKILDYIASACENVISSAKELSMVTEGIIKDTASIKKEMLGHQQTVTSFVQENFQPKFKLKMPHNLMQMQTPKTGETVESGMIDIELPQNLMNPHQAKIANVLKNLPEALKLQEQESTDDIEIGKNVFGEPGKEPEEWEQVTEELTPVKKLYGFGRHDIGPRRGIHGNVLRGMKINPRTGKVMKGRNNWEVVWEVKPWTPPEATPEEKERALKKLGLLTTEQREWVKGFNDATYADLMYGYLEDMPRPDANASPEEWAKYARNYEMRGRGEEGPGSAPYQSDIRPKIIEREPLPTPQFPVARPSMGVSSIMTTPQPSLMSAPSFDVMNYNPSQPRKPTPSKFSMPAFKKA